MRNIATELQEVRFILLNKDESPFTDKEYNLLEDLVDDVPYEKISKGDAGDVHKIQVGRFIRDEKIPVDLHESAIELKKIINSPEKQKFYKNITGFSNVCIRRAQANILNKGDYVGVHIDGEGDAKKYKGTHKDYHYAVIIHFKKNYEGGDSVIHYGDKRVSMELPSYSMNIICGDLPHEIEVIKKGSRKTLVYFLSDNFGQSR
jgi:predicted 2-oxoglutarate/Fe(II)-dependent dioxygenase YbiX